MKIQIRLLCLPFLFIAALMALTGCSRGPDLESLNVDRVEGHMSETDRDDLLQGLAMYSRGTGLVDHLRVLGEQRKSNGAVADETWSMLVAIGLPPGWKYEDGRRIVPGMIPVPRVVDHAVFFELIPKTEASARYSVAPQGRPNGAPKE